MRSVPDRVTLACTSVLERMTSSRSVYYRVTSASSVPDKVTIARASISKRVTHKLGLYPTG